MTTEDVDDLQVQLQHQDTGVVTIQTAPIVATLAAEVHVDGTTAIIQDGCGEPESKRMKLDDDFGTEQSIKQILFNINKAICLRLDSMESKLEGFCKRMQAVEDKVEALLSVSRQHSSLISQNTSRRGAVIVGLPQNGTKMEPGGSPGSISSDGIQSLGPNVTLITLNTEDDFPDGTWLGDENNPEMRVRVHIKPSDLLHIHSNCRTPEKMALTLLDYLFDRGIQADSNLSGMGKHGKKQLDPLMIYGIRCHLIHRFGITENDWHRIKQNIDSKCRTAWRRRQRGMPLSVKAFRGKAPASYVNITNHMGELVSDEDSISHDGELHIHQADIQAAVAMTGDGSHQGEIQILHATPEQISQLQQAHHIQILSGDQVIGQIQQGDLTLQEGVHVATVTTETGEVLQIQHNAVVTDVQE